MNKRPDEDGEERPGDSALIVQVDKRGIELRRSAVIGNDLDAEPAIPVLIRITDRLFEARLSRQLAVSAGADRLHERHRTVDDRQAAGQPDGRAPVDGESVTHQLRSVVTHLHLVHPPTLAVGSAVLAMLSVIAWRFPRSPGPLIAMILAGGCVALSISQATGSTPLARSRVVCRCQPCPA